METASNPVRPPSAIDDDSISEVEVAILEDRRITVRQLAQDVKISIDPVEKKIHDHVNMQRLMDTTPAHNLQKKE